MAKVYSLGFVYVPPYFTNQRTALPGYYAHSITEWHQKIEERVRLIAESKRPILTMTDTIKDSVKITENLKAKHHKPKVINGIQSEDETRIIDNAGTANALIVGTNTVTRGIDILLTEESKHNGGLHAILASWWPNGRVRDQRIGRVGRQGQKGSFEVIVHRKDKCIKALIPNPAHRAMLTSDNFQIVLEELTLRQTVEISKQRIKRALKEITYYQIFTAFTDLLNFCYEELEQLPLTAMIDNLKKIQDYQFSEHHSLSALIPDHLVQQGKQLLSQQNNSMVSNWQPFLQTVKIHFFKLHTS